MPGIGVSLSGGGHRASLFGLGVLMYLADCEANRHVTSISSVSGGSTTNGFVAQAVDYQGASGPVFDEAVRPLVRQLAHKGTFQGRNISKTWKLMAVAFLFLVAGIAPLWWIDLTTWHRYELFAIASFLWSVVFLSPLLGGGLGKAYGALLGSSLLASVVVVWVVPLPQSLGRSAWQGPVRLLMLVGALAVWDVVVFARRGWIAGRALRRLLPARRGDGSRLSGMRGGIDHVLCSAELQSSENLYFGRDFVYGYRFGVGSPGALPLYKAVRASSALPVAFPTFHLGASRFSFSYPAGESPRRRTVPSRPLGPSSSLTVVSTTTWLISGRRASRTGRGRGRRFRTITSRTR